MGSITLPHNPIDLEQREGRIKRYKSLTIRRGVAGKYKDQLNQHDLESNIWDALFRYAETEKNQSPFPCDLIPFWHIHGEKNSIQSIVPIYQYSKDMLKYKHIKLVIANYRLTFGQPNQQDLVHALSELPTEVRDEINSLMINLSPIKRTKGL